MVFSLIIVLSVLSQGCNKTPSQNTQDTKMAFAGLATSFKVVPLPDPHIAGFHFPEAESTIDQWISSNDTASISLHGWGIWTALTINSGEQLNGQALRVFETWLTPDDIAYAIKAKKENRLMALNEMPRSRGRLKIPTQTLHAEKNAKQKLMQLIQSPDSARILGFVKYDPTAAEFTINNSLYLSSTLIAMLKSKKTSIPDFPDSSIVLKPVFEIITKKSLSDGFYQLKAWAGPPSTAVPFPEQKWKGCVYVDLSNHANGKGSIDFGCQNRMMLNTYNLNDFIYFKLDEQTAEDLRNHFGLDSATEGDIALLVAMHVTSREIKRWTWQTFWWAPDPMTPPAPSSAKIAAQRPQELQGAARHYAMSVGYTFITPDQPITGGDNIGMSAYAYNPYLEAQFGPETFYDTAKVLTHGKQIVNNVGIRTNCMSCHALANYSPTSISPGYMADTYIDIEGVRFKGVLKLDFLWSIQGNIIEDRSETSMKKP